MTLSICVFSLLPGVPSGSFLPPSAQFTWETPAGQQDELTITSVIPPGIL